MGGEIPIPRSRQVLLLCAGYIPLVGRVGGDRGEGEGGKGEGGGGWSSSSGLLTVRGKALLDEIESVLADTYVDTGVMDDLLSPPMSGALISALNMLAASTKDLAAKIHRLREVKGTSKGGH